MTNESEIRLMRRIEIGAGDNGGGAVILLTEKQRADAIRSCERIQELCAQQQTAFQNILKIFDNLAKGKEPKDGLKEVS